MRRYSVNHRRFLARPVSMSTIACRRAPRALAASLLLLSAACASKRDPGVRVDGSPTVITAEEITRARVTSAFDAVSQLRPSFLRNRGRTTLNLTDVRTPTVYLDETLMGDVSKLREIAPHFIWQIRYLSASEAQMKWGSGHPAGVIQVVTQR